jgi:hypothetical protein
MNSLDYGTSGHSSTNKYENDMKSDLCVCVCPVKEQKLTKEDAKGATGIDAKND